MWTDVKYVVIDSRIAAFEELTLPWSQLVLVLLKNCLSSSSSFMSAGWWIVLLTVWVWMFGMTLYRSPEMNPVGWNMLGDFLVVFLENVLRRIWLGGLSFVFVTKLGWIGWWQLSVSCLAIISVWSFMGRICCLGEGAVLVWYQMTSAVMVRRAKFCVCWRNDKFLSLHWAVGHCS